VKKCPKPKENKNAKADEHLHSQDGDVDTSKPEEPLTEFPAKLNKWGFLHVPKKAVQSLPFEPEKPLIARIENNHLTIAAATENQQRTDKA
jgi:hypothetical protein